MYENTQTAERQQCIEINSISTKAPTMVRWRVRARRQKERVSSVDKRASMVHTTKRKMMVCVAVRRQKEENRTATEVEVRRDRFAATLHETAVSWSLSCVALHCFWVAVNDRQLRRIQPVVDRGKSVWTRNLLRYRLAYIVFCTHHSHSTPRHQCQP